MLPDDSIPNPSICIDEETHSFNRFLLRGKGYISEDEWPKGVTFYMSQGSLPDFILGGLTYLPMSDSLRLAVESCHVEGVQFLPVDVVHPATERRLQYWIMNVVNTVEGLNWEETKWVQPDKVHTHEHPVLNVLTPVLDIDKVDGLDIFHLTVKDELSTTVYISEWVRESIGNSNTALGLKLKPVIAM